MSNQIPATQPGANLEYHGLGQRVSPGRQYTTVDFGTLVTDRFSLSTCTAVYSIPAVYWDSLPDLFAFHPIFTPLMMEHREVKIVNGFAVATCSYAGYIPPVGGTGSPTPVAELVLGTSEDPIETNPLFVMNIGGTATAPSNGAVFFSPSTGIYVSVAQGNLPASNSGFVFDHFDLFNSDGSQNTFSKIDSYLSAFNMTYKVTQVTNTPVADISKCGYIDTPLSFSSGGIEIAPPSLDSPRNWLNMGISQTQRGSAFLTVTEWRASGPRGWNTTIYDEPA